MGKRKIKQNILPYVSTALLFIIACVLQQVDDLISNYNLSKFMVLTAQCIFFWILTYWTVSVINRVSNKSIKVGLVTTIILMSSLMLLKIIKYNVIFNATAERYFWYSYYIPQCLAPSVLLLTVLKMARKGDKPLSIYWNLLFIPSLLMIIFVFTNDLHQQVFSFKKGLEYANKIYKWEWGYYAIFCWIAGLYLANGILLYIKCRISHCKKKAWIPLTLFISCLTCCILREIFNPLFIKMPETVVFSVVIVYESLIIIGLIPSNTEYACFFDEADVAAMIVDKNFNVKLSAKNAPKVSYSQIVNAFTNEKIALSKDITLKAKPITGGEVLWIEDMSVINEINNELVKINAKLAEEVDLITAENNLKEQRSKIEEQNNLYKEILSIAKPHFKKISKFLANASTSKEKDIALRKALVQGVFLKRHSNLLLTKSNEKVAISELVYALRETADALTYFNVYSTVFANDEGNYPFEKISLIFECFEDCIEYALPDLTACLVRLSNKNDELSCRIVLDNVKNSISKNWHKKKCDKLNAKLNIEKSDETLYINLNFENKEVAV